MQKRIDMPVRSCTRICEQHHLLMLPLIISTIVGVVTVTDTGFGADISCKFKAATDPTEIMILSNGKNTWSGTIERDQTKTIAVPEGPFTVVSKIYNPNLLTNEDVRIEVHTRQCHNAVTLNVPLFLEPK